jgi:hypothetical protein
VSPPSSPEPTTRMLLSEAVRDLARDRPRRVAVLVAALVLVALAAVLASSSSSSSPSSSSSSSTLPASPARLCATKTKTTKNNMGLLGAPTAGNPDESRHAAEFAVAQLQANAAFPKTGDAPLALARLVSAQRQVVAGTNHVLVLETKDGSGAIKTVHATVWEKLPDRERNGQRDMELTKFQVADGGAPAAEGVEEGGGGGCEGAAAAGWQGAAARAAVDGINARSNSLVPYELSAVLEAKRGASAADPAELKLELKRGDKSETFRVSVREKEEKEAEAANGGAFGLLSFAHEP